MVTLLGKCASLVNAASAVSAPWLDRNGSGPSTLPVASHRSKRITLTLGKPFLGTYSTTVDRLFEMLVACDVLRWAHEYKPDILPAISGWRKPVAVNACNFVRFRMLIRVNYPIDSGTAHFVSGLENIKYCSRNLPQHEPPPQVAAPAREE